MNKPRIVVLDIETTGISYQNAHKIIECAVIELDYAEGISFSRDLSQDKLDKRHFWHSYFNPMRDIPAEATRIHGLTRNMLKDKPLFEEKAEEMLDFIGDAKIIAHNGLNFDIPFLNHELTGIGAKTIDPSSLIDTLLLARKKFPARANNLDALCRRFNIDTSLREKHSAVIDCILLSKVYFSIEGREQFEMTLDAQERQVGGSFKSSSCEFLPAQISQQDKDLHASYVDSLKKRWDKKFIWDKKTK